MSNITVYVSKKFIHLVRSISQPDNFISQIGVFLASSHFCICPYSGHGFLLFHKREMTDQILLNLSMPLCRLWSLKGLQRQILVRQCALLANARFLERP